MTGEETVIDVAVNHLYAEEEDIVEYISEGYAERFTEYGQPLVGIRGLGNTPGFETLFPEKNSRQRNESPSECSPPEIVRESLLDRIDVAVLTGSKPFYAPNSIPNKDYGNALCSAYNDYTIENWLEADNRFRYTMVVNHQDPEAAAGEIRRLGDHPQIVAVNLSPRTDRPFGNKEYDPIYEAIENTNLVLTIRPTYESAGIHGHPPSPAGYHSHGSEQRVIRHTQIQAHLQSFVFEGTFEKFPDLNVASLGWGWSWLPGYFWRLDSEWKNLHTEIPWVKKPPSEYLKDHVRFDLHGVTNLNSESYIKTVFDWIDGGDFLMYGSDFPRSGMVNLDEILPSLPTDTRQNILSKNAAAFFDLA